jgi:hypothetical protein
VNVRVSRGVHPTLPKDFVRGEVPTVIVHTSRIDFAQFAREYQTGATRRPCPCCWASKANSPSPGKRTSFSPAAAR